MKAASVTFTGQIYARNGAQTSERAQAPNEDQLLPRREVFTREDNTDQINGRQMLQIEATVQD